MTPPHFSFELRPCLSATIKRAWVGSQISNARYSPEKQSFIRLLPQFFCYYTRSNDVLQRRRYARAATGGWSIGSPTKRIPAKDSSHYRWYASNWVCRVNYSIAHDFFSSSSSVGVDIDLPMIAVIGSQSAGKSSLIESISGITLPRAAGTCTR